MIPGAVERRIFVVGAPRSGTTLVQSLLAAHSALTSFTESHFFSRHYRRVRLVETALLTRDPLPRCEEFLRENGVDARLAAELLAEMRSAVAPWPRRPLRSRPVARAFVAGLDRLAIARGRTGWVEKTPRHLRFVPFLDGVLAAAPRPRFIHVVREGLDVVASLAAASRAWGESLGLKDCARRWNSDLALSCERIGSPRDHFVVYEELAAGPEVVVGRLLDALGLDREPEMLAAYPGAARHVITEAESWKSGVGRPIVPSRPAAEALDPAQREGVRRLLRHDLHARLVRAARGGADTDATESS